MSTSILPAIVTAGILGVTHAIEPDHVAGISSLTSEYGDSRLSALAGACFSLGHVALVVTWLAIAYVLLGQTTFPAVFDDVGTLGVGVILGVLGAAMAAGGLRRVVRTDEHTHSDVTHSHPHIHLRLPSLDSHDHGNDTASYLKAGLVGALFTLSPPVSMILFSSTLLPTNGPIVVALAVVTYGSTITVTMSLLGAGVGTLFGLTSERSAAVHGAAQAIAGVSITAIAASLLLDAVLALL